MPSDPLANCFFCNLKDKVLLTYNSADCIHHSSSISVYHRMLVPKRHVVTLDALSIAEMTDLFLLASLVKKNLVNLDQKVTGFSLVVNESSNNGNTAEHLHMHLIPKEIMI
jgi:diadenosine tetraphosphate (Ap4A) HIT family hydrolase